jgi:nitroreductase
LGLRTCWVGAFNAEAARDVIGLGEGFVPVAFTPLGYADKVEYKKTRKDLDELVVYIG